MYLRACVRIVAACLVICVSAMKIICDDSIMNFFLCSKFLFPRVAILTCPENGVRICPFRSKNISFFGIRSSSRNVQVG